MRSSTTLLLILALPLGACAHSTRGEEDRSQRQRAQAIEALVKKADADSLAAAGLLSVENPGRSYDLLTRAVATAPQRPDLLWLQARACQKQAACDPEPLDQRLRTLDAENGAAWLSELARAEALNDAAASDAALAAIGRSERVDIYWTVLVARLCNAAVQSGAISASEAEIWIIGALAAQAIPAYHIVVISCKEERLQRAGVLEACRGVAQAFEHGDSLITEMIGIAIAKRVWPEQSPEWAAATEARRVFDYRAKLLEKIDIVPPDEDTARTYLMLCAENHREQDVLRAQLIAAGKDPDPPRN